LGTAVVERPEAAVSQPRLYLDEDSMRRSLVFGLRARNIDVLTALEAQMINRGDEDHLAAASAPRRVRYTFIASSTKPGFLTGGFTP
jgi:hypothetical protein